MMNFSLDINDQPSSSTENQKQQQQQQDEKWHQQRESGSNYRGGNFSNGNGNRNYNRSGLNNYYQQSRRGPRMLSLCFFNLSNFLMLFFRRWSI